MSNRGRTSLIPKQTVAGRLTSVKINLGDLDPPSRKFSADYGDVLVRRNDYKLAFGQEKIDDTGLRSLIVVSMSADGAKAFLRSLQSLANGSNFEEYIQSVGAVAQGVIPLVSEPPQTFGFRATHGLVGFSNQEATLDFFHATMIAPNRQGKEVGLTAVVRVEIQLSLFAGMVNKLASLLAQGVVASTEKVE